MDCLICSPLPFFGRSPRYTICEACYERAISIITLTNKLDGEKGSDKTRNTTFSSSNTTKGFANVLKWVKEMKDTEDMLNEKISYLGGFAAAFKNQIHTDIQVKPGDDGPSVPAHKALLVLKWLQLPLPVKTITSPMITFQKCNHAVFDLASPILILCRHQDLILDSDGCKAPPNDTITLHELNHEEVESLLEFLYSGDLPKEKVEKHKYSLSIAADKYDIPFLRKFCSQHMLGSLNSSNALDILEISDSLSNQSLKETALNFVVRNMEDVVFAARFDAFAIKNPHLTVQITRASFMDKKNERNGV